MNSSEAVSDADLERRVLDALGDGVWAIDLDGETLFVNTRAGELLGRTHDEMAGTRVVDVLDDDGRAQFERHLADLARRGPNEGDVECVYRRPDGTPVHVVVGESALYDGDRLIGYVHRLTEDGGRRRLLAELTRSRAQLAQAQDIARVGSWELDVPSSQLTWSDQLFVLLGMEPGSEVARGDFFDHLVPADRGIVRGEFERTLHESGEHTADGRVLLPDGSTCWVRAVGQILETDDAGVPVRLGGTVQDIDALKRAELELMDALVINTLMQVIASAANEATTLNEALQHLRDLLLAHDDWSSAVALRVVGTRLEPMDVVPGDPPPTPVATALAERALAAGDIVFDEETVAQTPSIAFPVMLRGEPAVVLVITARTPFERPAMMHSLVSQVAGQLAQVAEREAVSAQLSAARDDAMQASRAKTEFLATMSHEIRTPLNGVIGLNDLLLRTQLDDEQRRLVDGMRGAGHALLYLINDILDFSKIEAGGLELETVAFELREVLDGVVELMTTAAAERGIALSLRVDPSVPRRLRGDPGRFGQVVTNLVSNAVKFTDTGEVTISVGGVTGASAATLRVEVADTGVGMDAQQLGRIFQPFQQADASTTRTHGGTGLGLAISSRLVAALGGEMGAVSAPGEGSRFWFTATFLRATSGSTASRPAAPAEQPADHSGHVLVVEDNEVNQLVVLGMLHSLGITADVAHNGLEGVRAALEADYDLVLMDLQMPHLDGFEATRRIRSAEPAGTRVPIVAVTASATEGERQRCLAAGMDDFLTKPIGLARLESVLSGHLPHRTALPGTTASTAGTPQVDGPRAATSMVLDPTRLDELAEMGEGALPLIQRAIDNFVERAGEHLAELREVAAAGDAEQLAGLAHRLKGSALNLGAGRVAEVSMRVQDHAAAGVTPQVAAELDELEVALAESAEALRAYRARVVTT